MTSAAIALASTSTDPIVEPAHGVFWALVGATMAAALLAMLRRYSWRMQTIGWALGLVGAAAFYPVVGLIGGAPGSAIALELVGVVLYGALALYGGWRSPLWIGIGWGLHGVWDLAFHSASTTPWVPAWYPPLCLGYDLAVLAYFVYVVRRRARGADPQAQDPAR